MYRIPVCILNNYVQKSTDELLQTVYVLCRRPRFCPDSPPDPLLKTQRLYFRLNGPLFDLTVLSHTQRSLFNSTVPIRLNGSLRLIGPLPGAFLRAFAPALLQVDEECYEGFRNAVHALGTLDALLSLAAVARLPGYVRPTYRVAPDAAASDGGHGVDAPGGAAGDGAGGGGESGGGDAIVLRGARHPTVERVLEGAFVPNDVNIRFVLLPVPGMILRYTRTGYFVLGGSDVDIRYRLNFVNSKPMLARILLTAVGGPDVDITFVLFKLSLLFISFFILRRTGKNKP